MNNKNKIQRFRNYANFSSKFLNLNETRVRRNARNKTLCERKNETGCKFIAAFYFYKLTNADFLYFNHRNPIVRAVFGGFVQESNIKPLLHLSNNITRNNNFYYKLINIQNETPPPNFFIKNKVFLCTLFIIKENTYQSFHSFTLDFQGNYVVIHQSWFDGTLNITHNVLTQQVPRKTFEFYWKKIFELNYKRYPNHINIFIDSIYNLFLKNYLNKHPVNKQKFVQTQQAYLIDKDVEILCIEGDKVNT